MKNDLLIGAITFILSAGFTWVFYLTTSLIDVSKEQVVLSTKVDALRKDVDILEEAK